MLRRILFLWFISFLLMVGCQRKKPERPSQLPLASGPPPTAVPAAAESAYTLYPALHQTYRLAFRPDGKLWSVGFDGLALWTAGEGAPLLYGSEDGLPDARITDLLVAGDGTLWGSSLNGVFHQEDGAWVIYSTADGLPAAEVRALTLDPGGTLWAGTSQGIAHFDGSTWKSLHDTLPVPAVSALFSDDSGRLWLQTEGGEMGRVDGSNGRWTPLPADGLPHDSGRLLGVSSAGTPWAYASYDHVYRWQDGQWRQVGELGGGGPIVCDLTFDAGDRPWLATCDGYHAYGIGVQRLVDGNWESVPTGPGGEPGTMNVRTLAFGPGNTLATATADGIYLGRESAWHTLRNGPSRRVVEALAVDEQGGVWMGFGHSTTPPSTAPLARFDGRSWEYQAGGDVGLLRTAPDGTVWAAGGCTLRRLSGDNWETVSDCEELSGQVADIAFATDGALWAAAGLSLGRYENGEWSRVERLIHQVEIAPNGTLWALGWHGSRDSFYLASYDGQSWREYPNDESGDLVITADGQMWLAGESGLFRFQGGEWLSEFQPLPAIRHVLVEGSYLWLFGDHEIARRDPATGSWTMAPYRTTGDPAGVIDAAFDQEGVLWLGTAHGLVRFGPSALTPDDA